MKIIEFCFDEQALATLRSYQDPALPDLVEAMKKMFTEQAQEFITSAEASLSQRQSTQMGKAAHKFKSSCHHLGAKSLADLCLQIENLTHKVGSATDWSAVELLLLESRRHLLLTFRQLGIEN